MTSQTKLTKLCTLAVHVFALVLLASSAEAQNRTAGDPLESGNYQWIASIDNVDYPSDDVYADVSIILLRADQPIVSGERARDIYRRALDGEDFAELARLYSECLSSAGAGGDLGLLSRGQMIEPVDELAFSMSTGQISQPILTDFGWVIVRHNGYIVASQPKDVTIENTLAENMDETDTSDDDELSLLESLITLAILSAIDDEEETEELVTIQPISTQRTSYPVYGYGTVNTTNSRDKAYWQGELERLKQQNFQSSISGVTVSTSPDGSVSYNQSNGTSATYIPGQGVSVYTPPSEW